MTQSSTYLQAYNDYHDTGMSWLDEIPSHWDIRQLKYIADVRLSGVDKKSRDDEPTVMMCNYTDVYYNKVITNELEFMTATASPDAIDRFELKAGDVIITKDSESWDDIAVPAYVPNDLPNVICGYHLALIRPSSEILGKYLFWAFAAQSVTYQFHVNAGGITRFGLSQQAIKDGIFPIPPLAEQMAIVDFLDHEISKIDTLIAELDDLFKLVAEKRQATISHAVTRGIDPDVTLIDSGTEWIGQIPEHWDVIRLRRLIYGIDTGISPRSYSFPAQEGEWGVLKTGCVNGGIFNPQENKTLPNDIEPPLDIEVKAGDILMSRASGSIDLIGSVALVEEQPKVRLLLSDKTFRLNLDLNLCNPKWFVTTMGSLAIRRQIVQAISGAAGLANNISQSDIRELLLPLPPVKEQHEIIAYLAMEITKLDELNGAIQETIELLQERRSALIAAAVTGKIRVTE